jgi:hypothetical protein
VESPSQRGALNTGPAAPAPSRQRRYGRHVVGALLTICVFATTLALNRRHNDFPLYYHEDEGSKAVQVASDMRNFHHPQLMLEAAQWAWRLSGRPDNLQATVEIGRSVSALFAGLAAAAAALLGYRLAGLPGLCVAGASVGLCPALLVYGHYMKEDAALAFGIAWVALASHVFWSRRGSRVNVSGVLVLGAACAVAASAKFAGVFALIACCPLVLFAGMSQWRSRALRSALFIMAFVAVAAAINHRALSNPRLALDRIESEHRHATTRHVGFTMTRPNLFHAASFVKQTMPHVLVLVVGYSIFAIARPRQAGAWAVFLVLFTLGYLALVSWSVLPYNRYALPVVVLAQLLGALAVLRLVQFIPAHNFRAIATLAAAAVVVSLQLPRCLDFSRQFADDSRDRLRLWAMRNLPPDAVVVQDGFIDLDGPLDPRLGVRERPQFLIYGSTTYEEGPASGAGPLGDLARMGVEYVAVTDFCFGRYFDPNIRPTKDAAAAFEYRRRWYEELFARHELVWSSAPAHPAYGHFNNPELRLYRLRAPNPGGAS